SNDSLFNHKSQTQSLIPVILPDGSEHKVSHIGNITLNPALILTDVLHIPKFKFNLLSVNKLTQTAKIKFVFYPNFCILQDLQTNKVLAVGHVVGSLYILDRSSFDSEKLQNYSTEYSLIARNKCNSFPVSFPAIDLW